MMRTYTIIAAVAIALFGTVGGVAVAEAGGGTPDTGSGSKDLAAPPGYSGINDPALQTCMATQTVCNPNAAPELRTLPWSSPLPSGSTISSRAQAEQFVRHAIGAPDGAKTFSELLKGSSAVQELGIDRNTNTDESRPVWIVTVFADVSTDGGLAVKSQVKHVYSAVVDAGSGQITDDCIGCQWLSSSQ